MVPIQNVTEDISKDPPTRIGLAIVELVRDRRNEINREENNINFSATLPFLR